jgi:hypothetical protein
MARLKALCVVAHPDDCVIFAKPFIDTHRQFDWKILYLTYTIYEPRGREISEYWATQGVTTVHMGFTDDYRDMENDQLSFNHEQAAREIANICKPYDLILTHNPDGDYGHIHHKFVSQCVAATGLPIVHFANYEQANLTCIESSKVDLSLLPLHREVITSFENIEVGTYTLSESAKELIDGSTKTWGHIHI